MGTFAIDIAKFHAKTIEQIDVIRRKTTLDVFSRIVKRTPVDTGRTRGNWQVSVAAPASGTVEDTEDPTNDISREIEQAQMTDSIFLTNNAPWILKLEYGGYPNPPERGTYIPRRRGGPRYEQRSKEGFSKQAPKGMVRVTLEEFPYIVQIEAGKNGFRD
nr:hypothetical protein 14 [bacterium]